MRKGLYLVLFVGFLCSPAHALNIIDEPYIFNQENYLHMAASYGLTFTTALILRKKRYSQVSSIVLSSLTTIVIGTLKEMLLDDGYNPNDQTSNGIGIVLSGAVVFAFDL